MYDYVSMFMERRTGACFARLSHHLGEPTHTPDRKTGEMVHYWHKDNLKITEVGAGLWINGSLCKYANGGSNVFPMTRELTAQVIEELSDNLKLDLSGASVRALEFGCNLIMTQPIICYINMLGDMPSRKRLQVGTTLYYRHNGRSQPTQSKYYDKQEEANRMGMAIPERLKLANILRNELTLKGSLQRQTKWGNIIDGATLYDKDFYRHMAKIWRDKYYSIQKLKTIGSMNGNRKYTRKEVKDMALYEFATKYPEAFAKFLDEGIFTNKKELGRLRKDIRDSSNKYGESDELIKELDDSINNAYNVAIES